jgi:hypothetical protein
MNAEREEAESTEKPKNPIVKRQLPAGGEGQPARPRRRSYEAEPSKDSPLQNPPETGMHPSLLGAEQGKPESPLDLSQPECNSPPFSKDVEDVEDDDEWLEYFRGGCRIHIDKVRQICSPQRPPIRPSEFLHMTNSSFAQTAC